MLHHAEQMDNPAKPHLTLVVPSMHGNHLLFTESTGKPEPEVKVTNNRVLADSAAKTRTYLRLRGRILDRSVIGRDHFDAVLACPELETMQAPLRRGPLRKQHSQVCQKSSVTLFVCLRSIKQHF